jgi:hypothetical protein
MTSAQRSRASDPRGPWVLSAIEKDENMITSICVAVPGSRRR